MDIGVGGQGGGLGQGRKRGSHPRTDGCQSHGVGVTKGRGDGEGPGPAALQHAKLERLTEVTRSVWGPGGRWPLRNVTRDEAREVTGGVSNMEVPGTSMGTASDEQRREQLCGRDVVDVLGGGRLGETDRRLGPREEPGGAPIFLHLHGPENGVRRSWPPAAPSPPMPPLSKAPGCRSTGDRPSLCSWMLSHGAHPDGSVTFVGLSWWRC